MQKRSLVSAFLSAVFFVAPFTPARGQVFQQERSIQDVTGLKSVPFSVRWNQQQSKKERQIARQKTKEAMKAQYRAQPQAFAFHYLAAANPDNIDKLRDSLEDYQDDGKIRINPKVAVDLELSLKKLPESVKKYVDAKVRVNINAGFSAQDIYDFIPDADNPYLVTDDQAARDFFTNNPEVFDAAVDLIIDNRENQRMYEGPVISQEGSPTPDPRNAKFHTDVSKIFDIPDIKPLISTDENSTDANDSHQAECNANLDTLLPGKHLDRDTYLQIASGDMSPEEAQKALGLRDEDVKKLAKTMVVAVREGLEAHQKEQERKAAEAEEEKKKTAQYRIAQNRQKLAEINAEARGAANIVALFDPELANNLNTATSSMSMVYDGIQTMAIDGFSLAAMGNVATGINIAMKLLGSGNDGPTPEQQIMEGIQAIIKLQQETLKRLGRIEGKIDRLQESMDELFVLVEGGFEKVEEIDKKVDAIQKKLAEVNSLISQTALENIEQQIELEQDSIKMAYYSDYAEDVKEAGDDPIKFSENLKKLYERILEQLNTLVSYSANPNIIDNLGYVKTDDIGEQSAPEFESKELSIPIRKRAGMLPGIAAWLNKQADAIGLKNYKPSRQIALSNTGNPQLFSDYLLPRFYEAAQLHYDTEFVGNRADKLRDQFNLIVGAAEEARASIPLALAVYEHHAGKLLDAYEAFSSTQNGGSLDPKNDGYLYGINVGDHNNHAEIFNHIRQLQQGEWIDLGKSYLKLLNDYDMLATGGISYTEKRLFYTGLMLVDNVRNIEKYKSITKNIPSPERCHLATKYKSFWAYHGSTRTEQKDRSIKIGLNNPIVLNMHKLMTAYILNQFEEINDNWAQHCKTGETAAIIEDLAKARYALATLVMAGYGGALGTHADFNDATALLYNLPDLTVKGGLTQPGSMDNLDNITDSIAAYLERFDPETVNLPGNDDQHPYLGFGNLNRAAILLHNLP